ncbi:MAG: putative transport system permease protein [Acidobacteriota bacterium]|jgi:putative ABC transport system permease protein|nr:putative transport system permease protein [Acidobacteriota bacterium]
MKLIRSDIYENLMMALQTLRGNKLRSILTVVGVVIGVVTVMSIASIISGIDTAVKKEVESFGTRSIFLYKFDLGPHTGNMSREERMRKDLTYDDAMAIGQLPTVELAVPFLNITNNFFGQKLLVGRKGKTSAAVRIQGTLPEYERAGIWTIQEGRFFTRFENDTNRQVCVIGNSVADDFFPYGSPVGETIQIGGQDVLVVGTLQKREQFGGGEGSNDQNNVIYVPYEVAHKLKPNAEDLFILAIARAGDMDATKDQIEDLLRRRRHVPLDKPDNFAMATADSIVESFRSIMSGVALAMIAISSVGLMVGGIGVMNIMLVSVTERTREIGVRTAIGARRRDILWQFLIEAMTLTGFGGLMGLLIGWALTLLIRLLLPSYVPIWAPVVGFVASVGIGMVFGLWPAWKAARLDPIEALRYE